MADFTETFHRTSYPTISPTAPSQDQTGRTVLISGGSEGIGYNIANSFAQAQAKKIVLVGRSQAKLDQAAERLKHDYPSTELEPVSSDSSDASSIQALWQKLSTDGIFIDVLVLNASAMGEAKDLNDTTSFFHFNITANLHQLEHFEKQPNSSNRQKILVNMSSAALQAYPYPRAAYAASKAGFSNYLCHVADSIPEDKLRIINLHPGAVYTPAADRAQEASQNLPIWDHPSLSANMAVWVSGKDAAFLHGRFLWANWDADELIAMKEKILADPAFLKIGVTGVGSFSVKQLMEKCQEVPTPKD